MKIHQTRVIIVLFAILFSLQNANASDDDFHYYDISQRDNAARDSALSDHSEETWSSKPPHAHTVDDANNSALTSRETDPLHLIRNQTQNSQLNTLRSNTQMQQNTPSYTDRNVTKNDTMNTNRHLGASNARTRQATNQAKTTGYHTNSYQTPTSYQRNSPTNFSPGQIQNNTPKYTSRNTTKVQRMNEHRRGPSH